MALLSKVSGGSISREEEEEDGVAEFIETCSSTLLPDLMEARAAKEEPVEEEEGEKTTGFVLVSKPMDGLNEAGPPPFLRKTYQMVDNPETDALVSWSSGGSSFVVWDQHKFSERLLPNFFKHGNFSSFVRQLNAYGFKKIDPDKWEFANEGFQDGKRHLLKSIKRRARNNKRGRRSASVGDKRASWYESHYLETLRNDQDKLKGEVIKLRQQEQDSCSAILTIEERIRRAESRQRNTFIFLAKAVKNPTYMEKLMEMRKRNEAGLGVGDAMTRKRKLLEISAPEANLVEVRNTDQTPEEGEEDEIGVDDGTIYLELDNLTEKPFGWWGLGLGSDLKEQTIGVGLNS